MIIWLVKDEDGHILSAFTKQEHAEKYHNGAKAVGHFYTWLDMLKVEEVEVEFDLI